MIKLHEINIKLIRKLHVYPKNLENRLLGLAKAPIIDDRKLVRIANNTNQLAKPAVVDSRELSPMPKIRFFRFFGYSLRSGIDETTIKKRSLPLLTA
jgi:hypothetical protein